LKTLVIDSPGAPLRLIEKPLPEPGAGEVRVRIHASPVNPSDLIFLEGNYGGGSFTDPRTFPRTPGFEASGVVEKAGPGLLPRLWMGRRVACVAPDGRDGAWAESMVTPAERCVPLLPSVTLDQASMMFVNPWTAEALLDVAKKHGAAACAQTAAAGALGRMIGRIFQKAGIPMIHIVRRPDQVELLIGDGIKPEHVLDSSSTGFDGSMRSAFTESRVSLVFDAVAGEMTGRLLAALPEGGKVVVYGALSKESASSSPYDLLFGNKKVEGFWLARWVQERGFVGRMLMAIRVQRQLGGDLASEVRSRVPLEDVPSAIQSYKKEMSCGKILIYPSGTK
jgi:NADPH:quinone reductase